MSDLENALYADARLVDLYDLLNSGDWDHRFYAERIGPQHRRVLDLGCGTGAFAVRLASVGHRVVACDPSERMVGYARRRPNAEAVQWIVGEARRVPRVPPFDVVTMTGHAFQCVLGDDEMADMLRTVRAMLATGGRFMFESRNPAVRPWESWTPALSARSVESEQHGPVAVFDRCLAVTEPLVAFETHYVFERDSTHLINKSRLRFSSREDLADAIATAGFRAVEWFGDWDGAPFQATTSREIIAICRA
ncbi:class I SAM-dependent methyltransferase [Burkholderia glumae]|uniref:Class I SAM-dependent methyltransferase n=1 Tax=Burkholderia glumae TaxID=337 RepID=A0AAP9XY86_BURGL|nr:class I SAM-dependent methyltransferase [Burkholderia glumae]ACR30620.1 SAM-dependent methyltransferase [Burkholderia glumae BGR1]AJY63791.1 methyltransferase small domain protein [Burkholderia glumae LMG 2196 = ATCC 33617]KHJ64978.1 SAM-dependent methyltransferase [Burkholderia glumae]MCM2484090.1 class I SAM-dependent methyltransferase [Burkholderia glumae]MCM2509780.1 class I SAM-dependent methyltransferase [Burkholderia glumae]